MRAFAIAIMFVFTHSSEVERVTRRCTVSVTVLNPLLWYVMTPPTASLARAFSAVRVNPRTQRKRPVLFLVAPV